MPWTISPKRCWPRTRRSVRKLPIIWENSLVRAAKSRKGKDEKKADWKNAIQHYTEALNIRPKNKRGRREP